MMTKGGILDAMAKPEFAHGMAQIGAGTQNFENLFRRADNQIQVQQPDPFFLEKKAKIDQELQAARQKAADEARMRNMYAGLFNAPAVGDEGPDEVAGIPSQSPAAAMGLTPQQQGIFSAIPPDTALPLLGKHVLKPAPKPSAFDEKRQNMAQYMPTEIADGIASGRFRADRHPTNGTLQVVDMATGKIVYPKTQTSAAPPSIGTPASTPPGTDLAAGTGGSGFFGNIVNTITDAFGKGLAYPQAESAAQALTNLKVRTQTALQSAVPGRPSNYLMTQLEKLSVEPNSLLMGDSRSRTRLSQTRDMLREEVERMETDILARPHLYKPKEVSDTRANVSQLKRMLKNYDAVVKNFDAGSKGLPPIEKRVDGKVYNFNGRRVKWRADLKKWEILK